MISIIVAVDNNGLIGKNGKIPWNISSELKHFQKVTTGGVCIFGRKTWDSLPKKPLPHRVNMVISKTLFYFDSIIYCATVSNLLDAINIAHNSFPSREIFICGGRSLYQQALPFVDRIYLSVVFGDTYEGDTYFPYKPTELIYDKGFTITEERGHHILDESQSWDFYLLERHVRTF